MASYEIIYKPSVEKDFKHLPAGVIARVLSRLDALKQNPFPRGSLKLAGAERLHRIRVSEYRIVYEVDPSAKKIVIH